MMMNDQEVIVKMIMYRCRENGNPVPETLAAYITNTKLNPVTGKLYMEEKLEEETAKMLVDSVVQRLDHDDPSLNTIKLQIGYDSGYLQQEYERQQTITKLSHESNRLIDEIVSFETKGGNDFEGITTLYKKIFSYLLYKNKQHIIGNYSTIQLTPTVQNTIEREVAAALESVLPRAGLRPFMSLSTTDKVAQLCELSNIVIGIRLFNKEIGKGGVGLESFAELLDYPGRQLLKALNEEVSKIIEECDNYTIFFNVENELPVESFSEDSRDYFKSELTLKRQYLIYVLELKSDVQVSEQKVMSLEDKYKSKITELQELIGNKTSIPKDQVYPRFDALSQIYSELLEEKVVGNMRVELFKVLTEFAPKLESSLPESLIREAKLLYLQKASEQRDLEQKIAETTESSVLKNDIIRLMPNTTPDFMHIPLDFLGFCLWTIVKKNGLLLPGKPNLGVFKYKERYCVFSDEEAIEDFVGDPENYMGEVIDICRKSPELIHLLKLQEEFPDINIAALLQGREGQAPMFSVATKMTVDKDAQTPLHFMDKNIVPGYRWNEWDMRREALQMANIRKMKTVSTQTVLSNFRRDNETQVWLPKDVETNTLVDGATNTLLPKTYIWGLRNTHAKLG